MNKIYNRKEWRGCLLTRLKIFCWLDHQNLATAQQVCKKWKVLASYNNLWSNLFKERWGVDAAEFYAPSDSKSWKDVYEVQDRCDRVGLALKITREGGDYYLVHQGEIQRYLGSQNRRKRLNSSPQSSNADTRGDRSLEQESSWQGISDKIRFFIGDLEAASTDIKSSRVL